MKEHHPEFAPSSLPTQLVCPSFTSAPADPKNVSEGIRLHHAQATFLSSGYRVEPKDSYEQDALSWGYETFKKILSDEDADMRAYAIETRVSVVLDGKDFTFGTPDVRLGLTKVTIVDWKFNRLAPDDYFAQLVAYYVGHCQEHGIDAPGRLFVVYPLLKQVQSYSITYPEALELLERIRSRRNSSRVANAHCDRCALAATCPAQAQASAAGQQASQIQQAGEDPSCVDIGALSAEWLQLQPTITRFEAISERLRSAVLGGENLKPFGIGHVSRKGTRRVTVDIDTLPQLIPTTTAEVNQAAGQVPLSHVMPDLSVASLNPVLTGPSSRITLTEPAVMRAIMEQAPFLPQHQAKDMASKFLTTLAKHKGVEDLTSGTAVSLFPVRTQTPEIASVS